MSWGIAEMILKGWFDSGAFTCVLLAGLLLASPSSAQDGATVHEGLEISIDHLDRGKRETV